MGTYKFNAEPSLKKMARIVEIVGETALTWREVAAKLHVHEKTASRYLWAMAREAAPRRIHIEKWVPDPKTGYWVPAFMAGNAPNKRKPKALTDAEKYKKLQKDPLKYAARLANTRRYLARRDGRAEPTRIVASPFAALGV